MQLLQPIAFEWDEGNHQKNTLKHQVENSECEQVILNENSLLFDDFLHSTRETRYNIIGLTDNQKMLFIAFTIRNNRIRVISARKADKKERRLYEKTL